MEKKKIKNIVKTIIKLIITVIALYFVFRKVDYNLVINTFANIRIFPLLASLIFFIASKYVSAIRLNLFFNASGANLSTRYNLKLYLLGMYYNLFLPGGIGGDGYKIYLLNKNQNVAVKKLFFATLFDRITGVAALIYLAVALIYFVNYNFQFKLFIFLVIPILFFAQYIIFKKYFMSYSSIYYITSIQSVCVQLLQVLSAFFILISLQNYDHIVDFLFIFLISSIVATLPITIGGIGSREITFLFGAQILHLDINFSVSLSFLFYLITAFVSVFGIYYSLNTNKLNE